jgi:hypothetical protein
MLQMVLTPIWPAKGAQATPSSELRAQTQAAATQAQPKAVESELPLKDLGASGKVGYYFSATNRARDAGGFKHLTQGVLGMNELQVNFTVLANGDAEEPTDLALEMLRSMRRAPSGK